MKASTQQEKVKKGKGNPNPSPSTRFGAARANPQSPGGWKKENTLSYQYNRFLNMSVQELENFNKRLKTDKANITMAEIGGYSRVVAMRNSLPDAKEIADRTEGRAFQNMDITSGGEKLDYGISATQAEQLIRARANRSNTE